MRQEKNSALIDSHSSFRSDWRLLRQYREFKPLLLLLSVAVILTLQRYYGTLGYMQKMLKPHLGSEAAELWSGIGWCGLIIIVYAFLPMIMIKFVFKENIRDYGLSIRGLKHHWKPYFVLFVVIFPIVFMASRTAAFQQMYPFIKPIAYSLGAFVLWELAYGLQFFAVEFLFRGYMLFGLEKKFGWYCLPIMTVPYCMIHFGKPMGESLGAILAGLLMGYLALKSRSIYGGALLHWLVALSMDALAILSAKGVF